MRKLKYKDIFPVARILKKIDFTDIPKEVKTKEQMGVWFLTKILNSLDLVEKELTTWLSSLTGMVEKDVQELGLQELKNIFIEISQQEDLKSFFESAVAQIPTVHVTSS
jgi:hypothetical protein